MFVAIEATVTALDVETDDFAELVTKSEMGVPAILEVTESHSLEVVEVTPNTAVVAGQVTVVDGETTIGLDVPILFGRFCFLLAFLLGIHAEGKDSHDDKHHELRNCQIFLHNVIVLGL